MKRILGVDIDGVLTDEGNGSSNIWYCKLREYFGDQLERKRDSFNFKKAYDLDEEQIKSFLDEQLEDIYRNIGVCPGAVDTLLRLKNNCGFRIILITARKPRYRKLTINWLKRHQVPHHRLIHESGKAPLARKLGIELFIEDNQDNARHLLKAGIPVVLVDKYHNRQLADRPDLYRVTGGWPEIARVISRVFGLPGESNIENIC